MANTIAEAWGYDNYRCKETHRLGSKASETQAATWRTFVHSRVNADGSGWIDVRRDGKLIHTFRFGPEDEES